MKYGAQVIQIFESWAHHLSEDQFNEFAKVISSINMFFTFDLIADNFLTQPYAQYIQKMIKKKYGKDIPVVYFANGGSSFLSSQSTMEVCDNWERCHKIVLTCNAQMDAIALDWRISMKQARSVVGKDKVLCGNVDPIILYGSDKQIQESVKKCIKDAGKDYDMIVRDE